MSHQTRVILAGIAAVLAFDLLASLASRSLGFAYSRASIGSYVLYLAIGFFAARGETRAPIQHAALAAGIAGLADASLGWAISWALGPGRPPADIQLTPGLWVSTAIMVVGLAAGLGALGGVLARRPPSSETRAV